MKFRATRVLVLTLAVLVGMFLVQTLAVPAVRAQLPDFLQVSFALGTKPEVEMYS